MPSLTFNVNNEDITTLINRYSYSISYDERGGKNSGTTLDGSMISDLLARKTVIEFTIKTGANAQGLLQNLKNSSSVSVTFVTPDNNTNITGNFYPELGSFQIALFSGENIVWQESSKITLTEI